VSILFTQNGAVALKDTGSTRRRSIMKIELRGVVSGMWAAVSPGIVGFSLFKR
jgi:hypothetical protein